MKSNGRYICTVQGTTYNELQCTVIDGYFISDFGRISKVFTTFKALGRWGSIVV